MLMEMAGSRSVEGRVFQDNEPDEQKLQNARVPNVEVDVRGDEQFGLIGSATGDGGQRCAEPGDVRWCQAVLALYVVKQSLNVTR